MKCANCNKEKNLMFNVELLDKLDTFFALCLNCFYLYNKLQITEEQKFIISVFDGIDINEINYYKGKKKKLN